jgi:tripartite-type tricarboxylate transporter receptor subunit TctC
MKTALSAAFFALIAVLAPVTAAAQAWPVQPVHIVVPFSPGTGMDILARTLQPKLSEMWHEPIVIENKPGASGNIGGNLVAKAAPDGYTLVMGASTLIINTALYAEMPYDPLKDLVPIGLAANASLLLVANPKSGFTSAQDLIDKARAAPGKYVYGSPGVATPHHLAMELFKNRAGVDIVHVPFSATGPALTQLLGGEVPLMFLPVHVAIAHVKAGKLTALAMGGAKRSPLAPDVPTLSELGLRNADTDIWYAMWAPARTPHAIVAKLNSEIVRHLRSDDLKAKMAAEGAEVIASTPEELARFIREDLARWAKPVRDSAARAE